jgi:hypothetical protein
MVVVERQDLFALTLFMSRPEHETPSGGSPKDKMTFGASRFEHSLAACPEASLLAVVEQLLLNFIISRRGSYGQMDK